MIRRKIRLMAVAGLALMLTFMLVGQVAAANGQAQQVRRIVVFDSPEAVNEEARGELEALGAVILKSLPLVNAFVVLIPAPAEDGLGRVGGVVRVDEDAIVHALPKPENPGKPPKEDEPPPEEPAEELPWGIDQIDAELAWATSTGASISVAIIDTGIDEDHPDLVDNIKGGVNFVKIKGKIIADQWDDDSGHGTHVAGSVAAADNDIGVIGVAPQAWLHGVKVLDRRGGGYVSDVILGIQWAIANDMQVINMSLGTSSDVQSLHNAVDDAYAAGIVLVAAAGNSGDTDPDDDVIYPAKYDSVIAVAATDDTDTRASWSSDGSAVELTAPGVAIYSTWKGGEYDTKSGTSMASPHVAGTVALLLATNPGLTPDEVRAILQDTADYLGDANLYGYGLVDAEEAATGTETQ